MGFQEPRNDFATDLAVYQADGKFVVVGYEYQTNPIDDQSDMVLARYNSNGSLDTTFGNGGKTRVDFSLTVFDSRTDIARSVQTDAQGRIVVAGSSGGACAVARLNSDGSLDGSFLFGGLQAIGLTTGSDDFVRSVAVDSLDRIIVGGYTDLGTNGANWDFAAVRLTEGGALDATFDGTGMTTIDLGGTDQAMGLAVDDQDRVVIAGYTGFQCLPHVGIERAFGHVAEDFDLLVFVALPQDATVPLFHFGGLPRGIQMMQSGQPLLDIGAGAHLLRGTDQDSHSIVADLFEEHLFFGVRIGIADGGDLVTRDATGDQLFDDFIVRRIR